MKSSKLLKVISIIMIIFGAFGLISNFGLLAMSSKLSDAYATAGIDAPSGFDYFLSIFMAIWEIVTGVVGVMYRNRKAVMIAGVVYLALCIISIITVITGVGFTATSLLSLIVPILYLWGWYQSN